MLILCTVANPFVPHNSVVKPVTWSSGTSLQGFADLCHVHCSRAANEEAQLRNQRGSDIFAEPDALQPREVNQKKLQVTSELCSCLP